MTLNLFLLFILTLFPSSFLAPFGFSCDAVDILDRENLLEEFSSIYQSWEDVFSRLIYSKRGIPDDRVAATIHRYLEIRKDPKVLEIIEKAAGAMKSLIEPPNTLELAIPCSHHTDKSAGDVINTAKTTATLLDQVILATYAAFPHLSLADMTVDSISSSSTLKAFLDNGVDSEIKKTLGISVPIRIMSPSLLGTAAFAPQCFSDQSIEKLVNAMNVSIDIGDGEKTVRRFTLQQYYTLLNLFSESEEVLAVFAKYSTEQSGVRSLEELQNGALGLCMVVHPTIAYVLQLKSIVKKNDDETKVTKASAALYRALGALRGRKEGTSAATLGDMHCATEAVTQALERQYSAEEDEEDKVEEEVEVEVEGENNAEDAAVTSSPLPVYLQLQLLMDRAEYHVEANQPSDALDDCNAALALDKRCVAAYALRSKLNPPGDVLSKDLSREKGVGKDSNAVLKADVLASAARDALAAFLIGGSSDLSYAAAAEEAARESCRIGARQIFEDRRSVTGPNKAKEILEKVMKDKDGCNIEDSFPRAWLVQSFFAGYESYRTAFGLENMTPEDEIIDEEGDMSAVIKSHYHDLKVEAEYKASTAQHNVDNGDSCSSSTAVDIDEEVRSSKLKLPLPPAHLADGEHSLDPLGYWVLRGLVGRLEGTQEPGPEELSVLQASEEKKNAAGHVEMLGSWVREAEKMWADLCVEEGSENGTDGESSTTDQEEMTEERAGENDKIDKEYMSMLGRLGLLEDEASDRIVGFKSGLRMGGRGSAQIALPAPDLAKQQYITVSHTSSNTDIVSDFDNETVDFDLISCGAYTVSAGTALKATPFPSSGGRSSDTTATRSTTPPSSPPCPAFKWCLELLLLPDVSALTGVTFAPSGTVLDVKPLVPASPKEERAMKEAEKEEEEAETLRAKGAEKNAGAKNYSWTRQQVEKEEEEDDEGWEDCDDDEEEDADGDDDGEWEDCDDEDEVDEYDGEDDEEEEGAEEKEIADLRKNIRGVKMGWFADKALSKDKPKDKAKDKAAPAPVKKTFPAPVPATVPVVSNSDPQPLVDSAKASDAPVTVTPSVDTTVTAPVSVTEDPVHVPVPVTASTAASPALQEPSASVVKALGSDVAPAATVAAAAAAAVVTVTATDADADAVTPSKASPLSRSLHACLLSVCSSIAYLSGDALGAVKCLRASIQQNITAGGALLDSSVKLGSLLIDMDQLEEAETILNKVQIVNPTAVAYLHQAELQIHKNDFHAAVKLLMKAQKAMLVKDLVPYNPYYQDRDLNIQNLNAEEVAVKRAKRSRIIERRRVLSMSLERQLSATIFALLGVAQFRCVPTSPEIALRTLQEGIVKFPENLYLLICTGEIMSQAGDAVKAIKCFKRANRQSPLHPLPYVNAARTYVQLNQPKKAFLHLSTAIRLDQFSSSTRVDLSQIYLLSGRTELALSTLQEALDMAKHVSEIRDVLTALKVAEIQMELQKEGVYYPPAEMAAV